MLLETVYSEDRTMRFVLHKCDKDCSMCSFKRHSFFPCFKLSYRRDVRQDKMTWDGVTQKDR